MPKHGAGSRTGRRLLPAREDFPGLENIKGETVSQLPQIQACIGLTCIVDLVLLARRAHVASMLR